MPTIDHHSDICSNLEDSHDDSSSLSSDPSATTTNTASSSMSSSTCGEMLAFSPSSHHQDRNHQHHNHHHHQQQLQQQQAEQQRQKHPHHEQQEHQSHLARKLSSQQQQRIPKSVQPEHSSITHQYSCSLPTFSLGSSSHHSKSSSRKSNGHNQTNRDSTASPIPWKRSLLKQHLTMKDSPPSGSPDVSTSRSTHVIASKLNNPGNKLPSSETHGGSTESLRLKLANTKSSSGFTKSGKPLAVIRATTVTTGRIPIGAKMTQGPSKQSKPDQCYNSGSDMIYSDTEYIQHQKQSPTSAYYHHSKYSYLTSPLRLRNTNQGRTFPYTERAERYSQDSSNYSQVLSPWLQRNGGFPMARNAMTEAESMESLASNLSRRPNSVANKASLDISSRLHSMALIPTRTRFNRINVSGIGTPTNGLGTTSANSSIEARKTMDKDGDIYASALSLVSNATMFSNAEDKQAQEIRRLRRELEQANEKVSTLTSQLNTNAHMVSAFEQSLSTMTARLQQLSNISDQKDSELKRLKTIIDELNRYRRKKEGRTESVECTPTKSKSKEDKKSKKSLLIRRHTFASTADELQPLPKHRSIESLSSGSDREIHLHSKHRKGSRKHTMDTVDGEPTTFPTSKGWFRNSITKAFRKSKSSPHKCRGSMSDVEIVNRRQYAGSGHEGDSSSGPNSPVLPFRVTREIKIDGPPADVVEDLKRQLREKEKIVVDLRLDYLTSAHELESFKEMINKMRTDMMNLKQDNDRLQQLVGTKSLGSSKSSVYGGGISPGEQNPTTTNGQLELPQSEEQTLKDQDQGVNLVDNGRQVNVNIV